MISDREILGVSDVAPVAVLSWTTKKGKRKWRVRDLLADERCSPAVLDFLRTTYVGRAAPPVEENWDSDEEDEERAVAAAGVMREEEEEPGG